MRMSPMAANQPWNTEGREKRAAVQDMFAQIAPRYDLINGLMSFSQHHRWRRAAVESLRLQPGGRALDVCCGTGDFILPLAQKVGPKGVVLGLDFCLPMLELAQPKVEPSSVGLGDACQLPVLSESVNAVSVGWGIRNVPDIDQAHREAFRVLKSGGRFVSVDMAKPKNKLLRSLSTFAFNTMVPFLGALFRRKTAYAYLPKSTEKFMGREQLSESMRKAGFVDITTRDFMLGNICMHAGKKP